MHDAQLSYMQQALAQAEMAAHQDEVPVGAVLVNEADTVIAQAHNLTRTQVDPTAHAEIMALRDGARKLMNYRLLNTTLYVTIEPCIMCMGAIVHARVARVVYGAPDPKWGAAGSLYNFSRDPRLNHHPVIVGGVMAEACGSLMQDFFKSKRSTG